MLAKLNRMQVLLLAEMIRQNAAVLFGSLNSVKADDHIQAANFVERWAASEFGYCDRKLQRKAETVAKHTVKQEYFYG